MAKTTTTNTDPKPQRPLRNRIHDVVTSTNKVALEKRAILVVLETQDPKVFYYGKLIKIEAPLTDTDNADTPASPQPED